MTSLEEYTNSHPTSLRVPDSRRARVAPPKGFEPGVTYDPDTEQGVLVTEPIEAGEEPDWEHLFEHFKLDPEKYEIVGPVQMRSWEGWAGKTGAVESRWLYYYKASFQLRSAVRLGYSIDDLLESITKDRRPSKLSTGDNTLVINISDWQAGKRDGDGTRGLIARVHQGIKDMRARVRDLRRMGVPIGIIYVAGVGDIVEGCSQHYAMQAFSVELNRRDQRKLARRLIKEVIKAASQLAEQVVVLAVGGNHGENRENGKAFTSFADNDDVAIFEEIAEALDENREAYGHVAFAIPNDELTVTLDLAGTIVTWAHGHQFRGGANPEQKARKWLSDQALGKRAAGDCDLLITGHYHHFRVAQWGPTAWMQCPALDGGSDWWVQLSGEASPPGILSVVVGKDVAAAGFGHIHMLGETTL